MNKFSWYEAKSIEDALAQVNKTVSEELVYPSGEAAVIKAGGVDLLDLMKEGLVQPKKIVNILNIPGLDKIEYDKDDGLVLGANVTLAEIESDKVIYKKYYALHKAVAHAATPQLRNMATLGGNLAQRTRCWYFRSEDHYCVRKGGGKCFAKVGENENHAIFNNSTCASIHSSSVSTALVALNASVAITNAKGESKIVSMDEFFVNPDDDTTRENILLADEIITAVLIPKPKKGTRSSYIKQGARESYDWATADVAVVLEMDGAKCKNASIVLGAAAPVPFRAKKAEKKLKGENINDEIAMVAAYTAVSNATPLSQNKYKIPLFQSIIKKAILDIIV
jgi:xanthine dehydrogenase YagS FAD-binding subunit